MLADIRPGIADEHGKRGEQGFLDYLFGVRHDPDWEAFTPTVADVQIEGKLRRYPFGVWLTDATVGPGLEPTGATALGRVGTTPVALTHAYGEGTAILLNFAPRANDPAAEDLLEAVFSSLGLEPLFGVSNLQADDTDRTQAETVVVGDAETAPDDAEGFSWKRFFSPLACSCSALSCCLQPHR